MTNGFNEIKNTVAAEVMRRYLVAECGGVAFRKTHSIRRVNTAFHESIAHAFTLMKNDPDNPRVRKAYMSMILESVQQYRYIIAAGYKIELYYAGGEPYRNSAEMVEDTIRNRHLYVLPTSTDFGPRDLRPADNNYLLQYSGQLDVNGRPMLNNDIFRAVHDFFGHAIDGNQFGAIGEENAWRKHIQMYSPWAARALTSETRGQNSWVNYGPHMYKDGSLMSKNDPDYLPASKRPFAEQKTGLLPDWCLETY